MKKYFFLIILVYAISSCHNDKDPEQTTSNADTSKPAPSATPENDSIYSKIWTFQYDSVLNDERPKKIRTFDPATLTPQMIVEIVNKNYPIVQIKYVKTSGDTVFVAIPNSMGLTQQMGSTGANEFMVCVTFTFTELKGIKHVSFDFEEGDHAVPGVYDRTSWSLNL